MRKTFYTLIAAIPSCLLFFISGCSKSTASASNNGGGANVSDLVASFTNSNSTTGASTLYSYSYDAQNRETELQISDGTPPTTYTYGQGTVTKTVGTATTIYTLNNAGLAASDNQGNTFTYDGNGYMISETNPNGSSTTNTVTGNNIVTTVQTTSTGTTTTYSFTFLSNPNTLKFGLTFAGTASANLPGSETINGFKYPLSYTYDSHGRVQTEKIVSGNTILLRTYTYIN
jgi:YD repeat-containing protein